MRFFAEKWQLTVRGDVVVAGDSSSGWNGQLTFNRRFGENMALNLGYRILETNYSAGSLPFPLDYKWDVRQSGPIVGYTWVF